MIVVANTSELLADGIITAQGAREIESRGRSAMVALAINAVLCFGILAATGGLILWLAQPLPVAITGILMLGAGLLVLTRGGELTLMFGNAAALIGAGMLMGGAALELVDKYADIAAWIMVPGGALAAGIAAFAWVRGGFTTRFVQGAILLMGLALHIYGIGFALDQGDVTGLPKTLFYGYAAMLLASAGWLIDVRLVTGLALVPFAQMLDTGTGYFHAAYVFWSPESTLSILQLGALTAVSMWVAARTPERTARHARTLGVLGLIVANLCALVGSLWGDYVGQTLWGPGWSYRSADWASYAEWADARNAFQSSALHISADTYAVLWAVALAAMIFWAAHRSHRGLFNASVTFAGLHAYTQLFESFGDEPLAYVIGGLAAIPAAWGMWRLNAGWTDTSERAAKS